MAPAGTLLDAYPPPPDDRVRLLVHFARLQLPAVAVAEPAFRDHLRRTYALAANKKDAPAGWPEYLERLHVLDWAVAVGCLTGQDAAWERLFAARTGRSDCLLVDALRARACRLYPRDGERQENSVAEFWSALIAPDRDGGTAVLARYDGLRPLAPWLIRVFQNRHLSELRSHHGVASLPDDDLAQPLPAAGPTEARWHETFCDAARQWLHDLPDSERLILGLRWRYRLSQREAAALLGVHEGTVSRQTDKLRDRALEVIGGQLVAAGWPGDDLAAYVLSEMAGVLVDEPTLSAESLKRLLAARGKELPEAGDEG
jgi:RNA polymerase sigma factor (sigma-70 family)